MTEPPPLGLCTLRAILSEAPRVNRGAVRAFSRRPEIGASLVRLRRPENHIGSGPRSSCDLMAGRTHVEGKPRPPRSALGSHLTLARAPACRARTTGTR